MDKFALDLVTASSEAEMHKEASEARILHLQLLAMANEHEDYAKAKLDEEDAHHRLPALSKTGRGKNLNTISFSSVCKEVSFLETCPATDWWRMQMSPTMSCRSTLTAELLDENEDYFLVSTGNHCEPLALSKNEFVLRPCCNAHELSYFIRVNKCNILSDITNCHVTDAQGSLPGQAVGNCVSSFGCCDSTMASNKDGKRRRVRPVKNEENGDQLAAPTSEDDGKVEKGFDLKYDAR